MNNLDKLNNFFDSLAISHTPFIIVFIIGVFSGFGLFFQKDELVKLIGLIILLVTFGTEIMIVLYIMML